MTPDWPSDLAAAGAAALVGAASTDAWQATRDRFARLFGRGDADRGDTATRRLDALRHTAEEPGGDEDLADARRAWRVRLQDLLEEHPDAAAELRAAIAALPPPPRSGGTTSYVQHGHAGDHGTVNMNQHGDQTIRP